MLILRFCLCLGVTQWVSPLSKYLSISTNYSTSLSSTLARACDEARQVAWLKQRQDKQQADAVDTSDKSETVSLTIQMWNQEKWKEQK